MRNRTYRILLILIILIVVVLIDFPLASNFKESIFGRPLAPSLGLDLRGGLQVVMEAPGGYDITPETLQVAATILENRANALGVSEVVFQVAGDNYIVGEFPGLENISEVIDVIKQTGLLEFVDVGTDFLAPGTVIETDYGQQTSQTGGTATPAPTGEAAATPTTGETATPAPTGSAASPTQAPLDLGQPQLNTGNTPQKVYHTVITGADLASVNVVPPQAPGEGYSVQFQLKPEATQTFADFTTNNVGKFLAIVLDKKIISTPVVHQAITTGEGVISGQGESAYTYDEANNLRVTLFYGSLPISLQIAESRVVGPTLGQESLRKSLIAGALGFAIVTLFMLIYYRAPGVVAIVSILIFGLITFALYLVIPVTLTLPGIAGFLLSVGSALDSNILQFERLKEELRRGRNLSQAVDLGWSRAWPSIRDSNLATVITSAILFWFGSTFGATIVKGFALTLALGVVVSLFTALFVSRTLMNLLVSPLEKVDKERWFGI